MDQHPNYNQLLKLAQSPAGQRLWALLQQSGGKEMTQLRNAAAAGDIQQINQMLSTLLSGPEAESLLRQLEESL